MKKLALVCFCIVDNYEMLKEEIGASIDLPCLWSIAW